MWQERLKKLRTFKIAADSGRDFSSFRYTPVILAHRSDQFAEIMDTANMITRRVLERNVPAIRAIRAYFAISIRRYNLSLLSIRFFLLKSIDLKDVTQTYEYSKCD